MKLTEEEVRNNQYILEEHDWKSINELVDWLIGFDNPDDCKVVGKIVVSKPNGMSSIWEGK